MTGERLQKFLARCGVGSRRHCEELIESGVVSVDGKTVTTLGTRVEPDSQRVTVSGERVKPEPQLYFALHKPKGVVCTHSDPAGRIRAVDLVPARDRRLYSIGRLDAESEGLLLLTNDGSLAQRVAHPRYQVPKTYRVRVKGLPDLRAIDKLKRGVWLAEGKTAPARVEVLRRSRTASVLKIQLHEGKNRHLRRVLASLQLPVTRLQRIQVGAVRLGTLKKGEWRPLTPEEVEALREGRTSLPRRRASARKKGPGRKAPRRRG